MIAFVLDNRLSREKKHILARILNGIRRISSVEIINGNISESDFLKKLESKEFKLVLCPTYLYLQWSKIEAFYGLTRTTGPTVAGYFAEPVSPLELGEQGDYYRTILLDFVNLSVSEIVFLIHTLMNDRLRTGIRPHFGKNTRIYCDNWMSGKKSGELLDTVLSTPEFVQFPFWKTRANSIKIALLALWSLIFEEGPGKGELNQALSAKNPRAYFQFGIDHKFLAFRLCYVTNGWSPKDALENFWPKRKNTFSKAAELLLGHADLLRVHTLSETPQIEIFVGFYPSSSSEKAPHELHSFWIEPIAPSIVSEPAYETPSSLSPHLKAFQKAVAAPNKQTDLAKEKILRESVIKIQQLRKELAARDEKLRELLLGGIGSSQSMPPPDAEALLDAFQERFSDAQLQIQLLEAQISQLEGTHASPQEIEKTKFKIEKLVQMEQEWILKIANILRGFRQHKKAS